MESEGPYNPYKHQTEMWGTKECDKQCKACIYAEGRKAAEKDFQELLSIAESFFKILPPHRYAQNQEERDAVGAYTAWKKARGIE